jgi:hypothetical protein
MRRIRKFLSLSFRERILLIKVANLVLMIRLGLSMLPFSTLRKLVAKGAKRRLGSDQEDRPSLDQLVWSVKAVSHYVPKATCLTQALAIQVLLLRRGYPARLEIGVMKGEEGQLQAHAWVESNGGGLNGGIEVKQYTLLKTQHPKQISW